MRWALQSPGRWGNRNLRGYGDMPARLTSVLVVEDEILISQLVAEVLCENGFAVHAVEDGEEALRYLKSGAAVDVLFTDIHLVGRMDGSMLAREARAQRPNCRSSIVPGAIRLPRWRRRCRARSS